MKKIELFRHDSHAEAEFAVNEWLKRNEEKYIDKIEICPIEFEFLIMIVYEV